MESLAAAKRRQALMDRRAEGEWLQQQTENSRQRTLAKRIIQRRANEEAMNLRPHAGCTPRTARCPEARIMLLDTPECCRRWIHQILADVARLLDLAEIRWWIDYGTLLGYVRHGGLIPFDKDCDLGILAEDMAKLRALQAEWLAMGYHATWASLRPTQRFRTGERMKVRLSAVNHTNTDIFVWHERPRGMLDRKNYIGADLYKGREFPKDWVLPLQRGLWATEADQALGIEPVEVSVPAQPEKLLEYRYGDWMTPERAKHSSTPRGTFDEWAKEQRGTE